MNIENNENLAVDDVVNNVNMFNCKTFTYVNNEGSE